MSKTRKPCPICGELDNPDCPHCCRRKAKNEYYREKREQYRAKGLCTKCGKLVTTGRRQCDSCLEKKATYGQEKAKQPAQSLLPAHLQEIIRQARREKRKKNLSGEDQS